MRRLLLVVIALTAPCAHAQERLLAPGDNLVVEGVPPIPRALVTELARYTNARSASFSDWHPLRKEMLITTRFANAPQLHRVAMPGGARTQLTFFDEPVGESSIEPVSGRYVIVGKDRGGDEFGQLYRLDFDTGTLTLLTDGGRSQNGGVVWSRDGRRIAYASTRRNGADRDLYVMDPMQPASDRRVLEVQGGGWGVEDWSPDGRTLIVGEYLSVERSRLHLLDVASGRRSPLAGADAGVWSAARFTPDGRGVYLITDEGSDFQWLAHLDLASRRLTRVSPELRGDVDGFTLSRDGRRIAYVTNEAGISRLYVMNPATRSVRPVTLPAVGVVGWMDWHRDGRTLGFTFSSGRSTGDAYSFDAVTGRLTRWTESELGGLNAAELPEAQPIAWTSFDGREITGFAYRPPARFTGRRPVLINIHGGPEGQSRPAFLERNAYLTNELGITLIYPNVRGSTGFGKAFVGLDNGMKREDTVKDIGALLDWIGRQPDLDPARVVVTGGSYGGYMTLATATTYNDRIRGAVDIVGISNFNTFLKNTEAYRRDLRRAEYGDERIPEMAAFFERTAPLNNAGKITKPLFIIQGGNDPRVPRTEAEQMRDRVRQNGSPVWYLMARDEGHGFRKQNNRDFQFYATVLFLRQYLLGD